MEVDPWWGDEVSRVPEVPAVEVALPSACSAPLNARENALAIITPVFHIWESIWNCVISWIARPVRSWTVTRPFCSELNSAVSALMRNRLICISAKPNCTAEMWGLDQGMSKIGGMRFERRITSRFSVRKKAAVIGSNAQIFKTPRARKLFVLHDPDTGYACARIFSAAVGTFWIGVSTRLRVVELKLR